MTWYAWVILGVLAVSSVVNILVIGKPRRATTPGVALGALLINGLLAWGVIALAVER